MAIVVVKGLTSSLRTLFFQGTGLALDLLLLCFSFYFLYYYFLVTCDWQKQTRQFFSRTFYLFIDLFICQIKTIKTRGQY